VKNHLHVLLEQNDPQLTSPHTFWLAEDAPYLIIEAAFHTQQRQGVVMWHPHGQNGFAGAQAITFPITADGEFHRHVIHLGQNEAYRGGMLRLRIDPVGSGEKGAWMKVRSVRLAREP